jgi:preprotein translocase SecE subunit
MNIFQRIKIYLIESYQEMKKVAWPTRKAATNHTLLVIGISLGVAAGLGIVDYILSLGIEKFLIK